MSRFNTGNPLGSGSPLDLDDNAKNLDEAANSSADTFQDRLGKSRLTWAGIVKTGAGDPAIAVDAADRAVDAADRAESAASSVEQDAEQIAQDAAQQAVDGVVIAVDGAVSVAQIAADRAETASEAAFVNADVYPDNATGRAAVADGEQFQVVVGDEIVRYRRDSASTQTEVARYPAAKAVLQPKWSGILNGWLDPFFREIGLGDTAFGRLRWRTEAGATGNSMEDNTAFDGRMFSKTGSGLTTKSGPAIYLDELGASVGDAITIRALVTGSGGNAYLGGRFFVNAGGTTNAVGGSLNSSPAFITTSATPQLMTVTATVPSDLAGIFSVYPYTSTDGATVSIVALWAYKGTPDKGSVWPPEIDNPYLRALSSQYASDIQQNSTELTIQDDRLVLVEGAARHTVDATTVVSSDSETIEIAGASFTSSPYDVPFCGWGEVYSPAGVSFNALRIKQIERTAGTEAQWSKLKVIVRTGSAPSSATNTLLAVGEASVTPTSDALTDIDFILKDPSTGAVKTLSDADFSGNNYFVAVYAVDADGNSAACGMPSGTLANSLGQAYYKTDASTAESGLWSVVSSGINRRQGFQHILMVNPVESIGYKASQALANDIGSMSPLPKPEVVMPPAIYGVEGRECNVYLDNLHMSDATDYLHDVNATAGAQQNERFTWTPAGAMTSGAISVAVHDKRTGTQLLSVAADQRAAAASSGTGTTQKVLAIGDSLIAAGKITQTLIDVSGSDVMGVQLLGTLGGTTNKHEGRGGWTVAQYASDYAGNPFWIGGQFDFSQYLIDNTIATPDWVFIHLGINDVFSQTSDTGTDTVAQSAFSNMDMIIASIKAADAETKIGLMIPTPPSADQDSFGANYATGQTRWRFKRNILLWTKQMITKYAGSEASRVYLVPSNTALDTVNNMNRGTSEPVNSRSSVMVERQNNGVHPATEGYQQIGDAVWAFLKYHA